MPKLNASRIHSSPLSALFSEFTQDTRLLRLSTPLGSNVLLVECARGEEGISEGYVFKIAALSTNAMIPLKTLIGQPVLLELLTTGGRDCLRPFHGHITAVDIVGANGGFARYNLTVEPWTAFLGLGRDSRIFQDVTVFDIIDTVFAAYQGQGRLVPAWRFDTRDRRVYARRSLVTQYQESNLRFVQRLMQEEGLFYFFEHEGNPESRSLGTHTMVITDHNGAFKPNLQPVVAFTQAGAVMQQDSMDRWRIQCRPQTNAVELSSWDYRARATRPVQSATMDGRTIGPLVHRDTLGAYAYQSKEQGLRMADNYMLALEAQREIHTGAGTVRTLAPGTTFILQGQAQLDRARRDDERSFLALRVVHLMHNNLSAELHAGVSQSLGQSALDALINQERVGSLHATGKQPGQRPLYRNRVDAIRSNVPYRSSSTDAQGRQLHPRPVVHGQQTAIVVGPSGTMIHTDRDHRIKVQFHWQRGEQSHSRQPHPAPRGHTGAPGDDRAGTWVRVLTSLAPIASTNWGSNALPRVGQEVLIDFMDGNIDRPVVVGVLYNGRGKKDAQHNQVFCGPGAAIGNAPAWFPGGADGHAHPAVLSGIKSQGMGTSQEGGGAYSQLVFDDSCGQSRLSLQHHANAHRGTAELNLGHLRHQSDNQRLVTTGLGAECKTEHSIALRSGKGLLLSTGIRGGAHGGQMDSKDAITQIQQAMEMQTNLADTAHKHNARLKDDAAPEKLPSVADMAQVIEIVSGTSTGALSASGASQAAAYTDAHMQLLGTAGIVAVTPRDAVLTSGATSSITAQDINIAAQGTVGYAVASGISMFTYGKANAAGKPNQETGMRLHAASGKVSVQSQSDATRITADKAVTVASVTKSVTVSAKRHVMLTAQGAMLKLEGGNISLHGPGEITFRASKKELTEPANATSTATLPPIGELAECPSRQSDAATGGDSAI